MKKIFCGLLTIAAFCSAALAENSTVIWHVDAQKALKAAATQNKQILVLITGSTWCGPCMNLERNVLKSKEFADFAGKNLILLKADIPRRGIPQGPTPQRTVLDMVKHQGGVPSVYLLNSKGKVLENVSGFGGGNTENYLKRFKKLERKK